MSQRALMAAVAALVFATTVHAGVQDDVIDALAKCTDVADKAARFDCYDRLAPQIRAVAHGPASEPKLPQPNAQPAPPAVPTGYQPLGAEILPMTVGISSYTVAPDGSFTVTLDNGQVWREHSQDFATPRFSSSKKNVAVFERSLLGGRDMYLQGTSKFFKVVRVK